MRPRIFLAVGILYLASSIGCVSAQDTEDKRAPSSAQEQDPLVLWKETMAALQSRAQILLSENEKLVSQNNALLTEYASLQNTIKLTQKENLLLKNDPSRLNKLVGDQEAKAQSFQRNVKDLEEKIALLEKENIALFQRTATIDEIRLRQEGQMAILGAQKVGLENDLRETISLPQKENVYFSRELANLKQVIAQDSAREQEIRSALAELSDRLVHQSDLENKIQNNLQSLRMEIVRTQKAYQDSLSENTVLAKLNGALEETNKKALVQKASQRQDAESQTKELEKQVASLRQAMDTVSFSDVAAREKELQGIIDKLEKERGELEGRLFDIAQNIAAMTRENKMIEDLAATQIATKKQEKELIAQRKKQEEKQRYAEQTFLRPPPPSLIKKQMENEAGQAKGGDTRESLEAMAYAFAAREMYPEALKAYKRALRAGGNRKNIYFNLAFVYFKMGNISEAIANYKNVLKIDPEDQEAKYNIEELRGKLSH